MPIEIICGDLFAATSPAVMVNADVRVRSDALSGANLAAMEAHKIEPAPLSGPSNELCC